MTQKCPCDVAVFQLCHRDFTGESAIWSVEDILGGDLDFRREMLTSKEEVQGWRCDDDFGVWVELGGRQIVDDFLDGLDGPIPRMRVSVSAVPEPQGSLVYPYILKLPPT